MFFFRFWWRWNWNPIVKVFDRKCHSSRGDQHILFRRFIIKFEEADWCEEPRAIFRPGKLRLQISLNFLFFFFFFLSYILFFMRRNSNYSTNFILKLEYDSMQLKHRSANYFEMHKKKFFYYARILCFDKIFLCNCYLIFPCIW